MNINFGKRDLSSPPAPMILEKFAFCFVFNLRKQYVTDFFSVSVTQNFVLCLQITTAWHYTFLNIVSTLAYQTMLVIRTLCLCLMPSLISSPTKQPYSKVGNSRMSRYGNTVFTSNFYWKLKHSGVIIFTSQRTFKQTFVQEVILIKSNGCFIVEIQIFQLSHRMK